MAEKVSDWEKVAKTADNADDFLARMVYKAYHSFDEDKRKSVVKEIKVFYAGEVKKKEEEHRKEIERNERILNPVSMTKNNRGMER